MKPAARIRAACESELRRGAGISRRKTFRSAAVSLKEHRVWKSTSCPELIAYQSKVSTSHEKDSANRFYSFETLNSQWIRLRSECVSRRRSIRFQMRNHRAEELWNSSFQNHIDWLAEYRCREIRKLSPDMFFWRYPTSRRSCAKLTKSMTLFLVLQMSY